MPLQFQTQGGVKKLLIHDSATNPQAPDPSLQGECCCLGYVRLTQCIDTGFACGTCPDSGTESGCDEDGDGSVDFPHVIYIDEGIWEEKAKSFTPSDCVGGGSWSSVSKSGAVLVTVGACAGFASAGTVASLPASCQSNIRSLDMFKEFEGNQVPPGIPANPGGSGAKNLITYGNCQSACEDLYYEADSCEDGQCGYALSEFQCPDDSKKFYIPCTMLETFFGSGQVDNNIGKVIRLNSSISGPCVKLSATKVCGALLPYDCVGGAWTKGAIDGEARIATSIVGAASDDCCNCQGAVCGCVRACKDNLPDTYTISVDNVGTDGNPVDCACTQEIPYSTDCTASNQAGGAFAGSPSGGCSFTNTSCCQQPSSTCNISSSLGSVTVTHPGSAGNDPNAASCFAGYYTSDSFPCGIAGLGCVEVFQRSGCGTLSTGEGQIGGGQNAPCLDVGGGPFMTAPIVAFKCRSSNSNDPCACPEVGGNCDANNCVPGPQSSGPCNDFDPDNDGEDECRLCEGNYEDTFFIYAAALYCPGSVAGGGGADAKWEVRVGLVMPSNSGASFHGPLRQNDNRENASLPSMQTTILTYQKDTNSEDPTGTYSCTNSPIPGDFSCTHVFSNGDFVDQFAGSTVTVG